MRFLLWTGYFKLKFFQQSQYHEGTERTVRSNNFWRYDQNFKKRKTFPIFTGTQNDLTCKSFLPWLYIWYRYDTVTVKITRLK